MALQNTNLLIVGSHLPATFKGTPDDLFQRMLERMKIVSPSGTAFFIVSDNEPSSNQGPWLKGGTQWWVWSEELKRYVPLDISASEKTWFHFGSSIPGSVDPPIWLRTVADPTEASPFPAPVSWNVWDGSSWIDFTSLKDKSVTFEKVADGLPGALITYDVSSRPVFLPLGSADQLLQVSSDGTKLEWKTLLPESLVGRISTQILGPLTDPTGYHILTQSVTITLAEAREVLIRAYANVIIASSGVDTTTVTLLIDGQDRDAVIIGDAFGGQSAIATVPVVARITLSSGAHVLTVDVAASGFSADGTLVDPVLNSGVLPVKFLVELL